MKLSEIYKFLCLEFSGADIEILALNSLGRANENELSYCDSPKNAKFIEESRAGAILVTKDLANLVKS
ncbi:MAG: LpxD N-terminal domain-containing protein, partial [Campylobacter hyointestinalis]